MADSQESPTFELSFKNENMATSGNPVEQDLNLLPAIHDILKSVEKDSHEISNKVNELKNRLQKARETVDKLPGIHCTKQEQMQQIDILRKQLLMKTQLLSKYKNFSHFDLSH